MRLGEVRAQLPVTETTAYLNTGSAGPLARCAVEAVETGLRRELQRGRSSPGGLPEYQPAVRDTRERLAALVGADTSELALTDSTTAGLNIVIWGLSWQPEDEVVTSSVEHPGVLIPLHHLAQRTGVRLRIAEPEAVADAITEHTRLVVVSHVSFSTGERLPLEQIVDAAHALGVRVLVDGAQSVGAIPVDVKALDIDFYAFAGQKWLLGPEGTGGLYVKAGQLLEPTHVSTHSLRPSGTGGRDPHNMTLAEGATRFESGAFFRPAIHGLNATLRWLTSDEVGLPAIYSRTRELASYCYTQVSTLPGVEMLAAPDALAGLVNFRLPNPVAWVRRLEADGILIRSVPETDCLRVSCAFFNTADEIDRLVTVLKQV